MQSLMGVRRQASMYLTDVPVIEDLRHRFNPVQARLIPAHVTLCREDEVSDWRAFEHRLKEVCPIHVTLEFGRPVRDGHLVLIPAISGIETFDALRFSLLSRDGIAPRKQSPHITLIHPRNGICTDPIFDEVSARVQPFQWSFREVSLIEQVDGGPWTRFALVGSER